jgi:hypothetical protein
LQPTTERKKQQMKKLIAVAAMAMLIGATVGPAQIIATMSNGDTVVSGPIDVNVKVKLSPKQTNPTVTGVELAEVAVPISTTVTNTVVVLGTAILDSVSITNGTTNTITSVVSSNALVVSDVPVDLGKGKFAAAAGNGGAGPFGTSNTIWYITGTAKTDKNSNTTVTAKAVGIWKDGDTSFSASITAVKTKK